MGKIILDPVEDCLDARNLGALIDRWLASLTVAAVTQASYHGKIRHFTVWWEQIGPGVDWRLTRSLLREFEVHLRTVIAVRFGTPLSYHTRHGIIRALRMMFRWAATTGKTEKNYGEWAPWPAGSPPRRKSATPEQLASLMLAASESRQPIRDQALLAFFIGTGCRRGEAASLMLEGLQMMADGSGTAHVVGKSTPANRSGEHTVAFDASTGKWLIRYIDEMVIEAGPVWLNDVGGRLEAPGIYQVVKRTIRRAGLEDTIQGCHDLRRAFATILGRMHPDSPGWADMIRRQLGHKTYAMTAHYTLLDADDIRERISSPLAGHIK